MRNLYLGQLRGRFLSNEDISSKMEHPKDIYAFSIYCQQKHHILLNGEEIEIGKTNILEVRNTPIYSLAFLQDEDEDCFIDYLTFK